MNRPRLRLLIAAAGAAAAVVAIALPATPAAAAPPTGSCNGPTCGYYLYQHMSTSGDNTGPYSSGPAVAVNPPPCWYQPDVPNSNPVAFVTWAIGQDPNSFVNPDGRTGKASLGDGEPHLVTEELQYANAHVNTKKNQLVFDGPPAAGRWYDLNGYAQYGPAAANCMSVPLDVFYVFAGANPPPPPQPVPGIDIAHWLANHMTVPRPRLTLSPNNKGYVNLATYLWATWQNSRATGTMNKYQITGTLGNESVTVNAVPSQLVINVSSPGTGYNANCTLTPDAAGYVGSRAPFGNPPNSPPGTAPDCGILYNGPTKGSSISVTTIWKRWWTGVNTPDGNGGNLPTGQQTSQVKTIPVEEIQSINNSGR